MSTNNEQQHQENPSVPQADAPKPSFDPLNLTEEDLLNYFKWKPFEYVDLDQFQMNIEEAKADYSAGNFWKACKTVQECLTQAYLHNIHFGDVDVETFYGLRRWLFELLIERANRIKRGEPDAVLPHSEFSLEEAKKRLAKSETLSG